MKNYFFFVFDQIGFSAEVGGKGGLNANLK